MSPLTSQATETRIGLLSRLDYPSRGYRVALWKQAAADFAASAIHYVLIAGGLIDSGYIAAQTKKLLRTIKRLRAEVKDIEKALNPKETSRTKTVPLESRTAASMRANIVRLEAEIDRYQKFLDDLSPEKLAEKLAEILPRFTGAGGEPVKIHIVPSPAFDGVIGEEIAHKLSEIRSEVFVYQAGSDRVEAKQAGKIIEVITPEKATWMRSDYFSTPFERIYKDRLRQTARDKPDLYILGGFGASIIKPKGGYSRPFITAPALHRLSTVRVNENQIGARVVAVHLDRVDPDVISFPYKDMINAEYRFIPMPQKCSRLARRILTEIQATGGLTVGSIAQKLNAAGSKRKPVTRELVQQVLAKLLRSTDITWPGLRYDRNTKRFNFNEYTLRDQVVYAPSAVPTKKDSLVLFSCLHAGSRYADLNYFLKEVPREIIARGANILVNAGDSVEGTKYRDEIIPGLVNVTKQEQLAGFCVADVMLKVFDARFAEATKAFGQEPSRDQIVQTITDALILYLVIPGNHCEFVRRADVEPLDKMNDSIVMRLLTGLANRLRQANLNYDVDLSDLMKIIRSKVCLLEDGEYVLPSGLKLAVHHPYMGNTKTISIRLQETMAMHPECQLVVVGNFHNAASLEVWEPEQGQRVGIQLGTIKRRSDFETHKLKTVDHGIAWIDVISADGRVVHVEQAFSSAPPTSRSEFRPEKVYEDLLVHYGIEKEPTSK